MATVTVRVARASGFVDYGVECSEGMTLLDALEQIRATREPGLRYRHSCHHGSCGTCGARVDGKERLLCITPLPREGTVSIEPLRKMALVADLAVDPGRLVGEMPPGAGYLRPSSTKREGAVQMEPCIECGLCVSACPVTGPFVGPAALAAADTDREARPERTASALAFAAAPRGVPACDSRFECSRACPQGVAPGRRITNLRRLLDQRSARAELPEA